MLGSKLFKETKSSENRETNILDLRPDKEVSCRKEVNDEKEAAETAYKKTITNITKEFKNIIPEDQRVRIDIESDNNKPIVLSAKEYRQRFPEADPNVLGHYDSEGRIYMKEGSPEVINHVSTHEAMHLTSYNELEDSNPDREMYQSGIREVTHKENGEIEDHNRALNEGITELYAIRELQNRGETSSVEAVSAYSEAKQKAYELEKIVGDDVVREAYFGGNTEKLKEEVIRLNGGDETAWDRYSKNVDVLEYEFDRDKVTEARVQLAIQNAEMLLNKELVA